MIFTRRKYWYNHHVFDVSLVQSEKKLPEPSNFKRHVAFGGLFVKKSVWKIAAPAVALVFIAFFVCVRRPFTVTVTLFYDERDLAGAVVSKQALQSVVLAMEFFNSRSSEYRFLPFRETDQNIYESIEHAASMGSIAIVGGINAPFASLLADSSRRNGIPFLSLASGTSLARADDFVFRARPRSGGKELGLAAKHLGVSSYSVIVSGFAASHVQEFIRDFESELGAPPRRTMVFSGNLNKHIDDFERIAKGVDAILLVLPDWLAAVALRELRLRLPGLPVFASNWAISHRTHLLAGSLGEGVLTVSFTPPEWDDQEHEFLRFVRDAYASPIPPVILAMGYDTVAMLDEAVRRAGSSDRRAIADALSELTGVHTTGGTIPVDENGDLQHSGAVFSLRSGRWVRVPDDPDALRRAIASSRPPREEL
jgi:branched-chain amino acid transport system substrate-binding protein